MLAFVYHEATVTSIQWVQHTLAKVRMEDPVAMKSAWTVLPGLARMILTICCLICTAVLAISVAFSGSGATPTRFLDPENPGFRPGIIKFHWNRTDLL